MRKLRSIPDYPLVIIAFLVFAMYGVGLLVAIFLPVESATIWGIAATLLFIALGGVAIGYMTTRR